MSLCKAFHCKAVTCQVQNAWTHAILSLLKMVFDCGAGADKTLIKAMQQQWLPQQDQINEEAKKIRDWLLRYAS